MRASKFSPVFNWGLLKQRQAPNALTERSLPRLRLALVTIILSVSVASIGGKLAYAAETSQPPAGQPATGSAVTQISPQEVDRLWPTLTPFQQLSLVDQLIKFGEVDHAERLLARTQYTKAEDQTAKRFYSALIMRIRGRPDEAISELRAILAEQPHLTRVRLELAAALYQTENDEASRHHLELVLGDSGTNPNLANTVRSYISAIDGRKRWDGSAYFSLAPSTNFNQGGTNSIVYLNGQPFVISQENLKRSGLGIVAGGQGSYRQPLTGNLDFIVSGGANTKTFADSEFNDILVHTSIGPRYRFERGYLGLYGLGEQRFYGNEFYNTSYGGLISGSYRLTEQDIVFGDVSCLQRDFEQDWKGSDLRFRDGTDCSASGRLEHAIDSATTLRILGSGGRERTGRSYLDHNDWSAGLGAYREMPWGITVYAQGTYSNLDFNGLYPGAGVERFDERIDAALNLTKRDWLVWGLAPVLQYTYTRNFSNVSFFDFDAHGLNATLTKRF